MQYFSHYIWESGSGEKENGISVVLQQVSCKKEHYLLACVCDSGESSVGFAWDGRQEEVNGGRRSMVSGYFTERLVEWFHREFLALTLKRRGEELVSGLLEKELHVIEQELLTYERRKGGQSVWSICGILLWENQFWFFGKGDCQSLLFNRRFNRKQCRALVRQTSAEIRRNPVTGNVSGESGESSVRILMEGSLQKNIGILLADPSFGKSLQQEELLQVLFEKKLTDAEIGKRLRELAEENRTRGGRTGTGAVFVRLE